MKNKKYSRDLPEKFTECLTEMFGVSLFQQIKQSFVERPTTFRVNKLKAEKNEVRQILFDFGFKTDNVVWYKDAFILKQKSLRELQETDLYQTGKIYVQSLASMVPVLVLDPKPGEKVLDLTAAPGSKTSQIAASMNREGELVANDVDKVRFQKLEHNMALLGVIVDDQHPPTPLRVGTCESILEDGQREVLSVRGKSWNFTLKNVNGVALSKEYPNYFDKILLDAPCTAEARIIISEPATYGYWNERNIKDTVYVQRKLLFSAWQMLKPGGILVYSTCTFAPEENELQITRFLEEVADCEVLPIDLDVKKLPIVNNWSDKAVNKEVIKKALRLMPTREVEGFFVVKMLKKGVVN